MSCSPRDGSCISSMPVQMTESAVILHEIEHPKLHSLPGPLTIAPQATQKPTKEYWPTKEEWKKVKSEVDKLWREDNRRLEGKDGVMELMKREHNFSAEKHQYKYKFRMWNWRKKGLERGTGYQLPAAIHERQRFAKATDVHIDREFQSRHGISQELWQHPLSVRHKSSITSNSQLPVGITIQTPPWDETVSLIVDLPFQILEDHIRPGIRREALYLNTNQGSIEEFETLEEQPSGEANVTTSDTWTLVHSVSTALKSVVPKSIAEDNIPGSSMTPPKAQIFTSSLHRQILFSISNNFAGIDAFPVKNIFQVLGQDKIKEFCQLVYSCVPSCSSQAIIQNMFQRAIEAGDSTIVDMLLRESPTIIPVDSQFCFVKGKKYTPMERASMLRYLDVVKSLLNHGAAVNKPHTDSPQLLCGALDYVVGFHDDEAHPRVDTQLFRILLDAGGELSYPALMSLIRNGEGELVVLFMSERGGTHTTEWSHWAVIDHLISYLDDDASVETISIILRHGAHLKFDAYSDYYGDVPSNPRRLIDVAAERGMLRTIKLLYNHGAVLTDDTLPCAIASGNQDLIRLLLALGADINCIGSSGTTPFAAAIRLQDTQVLQLIDYCAAAVILQGQEQMSAALNAASDMENISLIEQLIHMGGKVSSKDSGRALSVAIKKGRDDFAKELIGLGADVNMDCTRSGPPLLEALKRRNEAFVQLLLDADADPNYLQIQGGDKRAYKEPSIALAVKWGNRSVIEKLIFAGADINACTTHPNTEAPLTIAVKQRDYDMILFLLALGADLNNPETRKCGGTALEAAVDNGDVELARFVLDHGADSNDSWALQKAMSTDVNLLQLLLERWRARYPMCKGGFGSRVLAEAVVTGSERVIRLMLENGVSAEVMVCIDGERATPFGHAIARQQASFIGCLDLFLRKGCKANDVVAEAGGRHFYPGASEHFMMQQNHDCTPRPRVTALLAAIDTRNISNIELIISNGGEVNLPAHGLIKRTPLQRAAEIGSLDIVDLLLNYGANVNAPAAQRGGGTALQLAAIGGYIPIACKLLCLHADPNAPASMVNGRTALEGAAEHGRLDMVKVLLNGGAGSGPDDKAQVESAIALAMDKGHFAICELLESHSS